MRTVRINKINTHYQARIQALNFIVITHRLHPADLQSIHEQRYGDGSFIIQLHDTFHKVDFFAVRVLPNGMCREV